MRGGVGEFESGEDPLAHLVRGHRVQGEVGDDAEGAQRDHRAVEPVAVRLPAEDADLAVGGDQFEGADRGAEAAVGVAGACHVRHELVAVGSREHELFAVRRATRNRRQRWSCAVLITHRLSSSKP